MLQKTIQNHLIQAMKNHDSFQVETLRFLLSAVNNLHIEKKRELTDEEVFSVIQKQLKSHSDSIEAYEKAGRQDLLEKEKKETEILKNYLPKQIEDEELQRIIKKAILELGAQSRKDMGKVMSKLQVDLAGKADRAKVAQLVSSALDKYV